MLEKKLSQDYLAQREQLHSQIWKIADKLRGAVEGWDFKQYVIGTLFYRFISENFTNFMNGDEESVNYTTFNDKDISKELIEDAILSKGYFIYPSQLFCNIFKNARQNKNLNIDLANIFKSIENSANGYESEKNIKGLFEDFDPSNKKLGKTVHEKNLKLIELLSGINDFNFMGFKSDFQIDIFGDAYEYLISNYASNAGKSGGEFFTPQTVSKLVAKLAIGEQKEVKRIYDPACGSGSLLLQVSKQLGYIPINGFYGQEINHTTYNLARMNMILHDINYSKFNFALDNTLIAPHFKNDIPFDVIVSNPPYSIEWAGEDDPTLLNDERFSKAGKLAPKSKADFAFVLHSLHYLSNTGKAAIVCFPGIFYRGGSEQVIRKYLIDNNYVESVISLPSNLFFGTGISTTILVLAKNKTETKTQFIDASSLFKKDGVNNILTEENIDEILSMFKDKKDVEFVAKTVDNSYIAEMDYNLSVNTYVEAKSTEEIIDIEVLESKIANNFKEINRLNSEIQEQIKMIKDIKSNNGEKNG
jgi:type I restriction enzyme M protein